MRLLADLNIAPRTVDLLQSLGHDVVRVDALLPGTASDAEIVETALRERRTILTQDLDFSVLVASIPDPRARRSESAQAGRFGGPDRGVAGFTELSHL